MEIRFSVPGKPVAKARPRGRIMVPKTGKAFVSMYSPAKTASEEGAIRHFAHLAMAGRPLLTGPLEFRVCAYLPITASWPKKKIAAAMAGLLYPPSKPDVDNYAKLAMDALNEIAYADDSQVVNLLAYKRYSDHPRLSVVVKQILVETEK